MTTFIQERRTLQEFRTSASAAEVLAWAKAFFSRQNAIYSAFLERESDTHLVFRGQGGEELLIAATPRDGQTLVTGSSYLFDQQIARFFATLPQVPTEKSR